MQILKSTLQQPRYVKAEAIKGQPNELALLVQGQFHGCNYAVMCTGPFPIAMVQLPIEPAKLGELSVKGLKATIGQFADITWVDAVVEPDGEEKGTVVVKFAFNKNGDFSVADSESDIPEVREVNEKKQKWTTEEVLFELLTFINGLTL